MKDTLFIGGLCAVIVLVGAALYFIEPSQQSASSTGTVMFERYAAGQYALNVDTQRNYLIQSQEELESALTLIHGNERPSLPPVDFEKNEVLAVFDGTHSTGGYDIQVAEIVDSQLTRTVHIKHLHPDENCSVPSVITSPYELVIVPKMRDTLHLTHTDGVGVAPCR
ncbi:MAG TPA: protease complex subunit PrcB family protein [Candidatus Paceibacterota bacterium]|nr:protease complex subunit PrcB family protein [Candidatus Paceibacterota bacterium]